MVPPRGLRPAPSMMTEEALQQAFPHLNPSQRLAMVEKAVRTERMSRRRRRRLARASKPSLWNWAAVFLAGLICCAGGLWNYTTSTNMLAELEARVGTAAVSAPSTAHPLLSTVPWRAGVDYALRHLGRTTPVGVLPAEGPERSAAIAEHRDRYMAYQALGGLMTILGAVTSAASLVFMIFRRA